MNKDKLQNVMITFDDGTIAFFAGRAVCFPGDKRVVTKVGFIVPKDLPDDYNWEVFSDDVETA